MAIIYWEDSVKEHLKDQKKQYLMKLGKEIRVFNDTSPEMIKILIEMKRTLRNG